MLIITLVRVATTLTFLILASGGPYAIWQLRRFIVRYTIAHEALRARVEALEHRLDQLEGRTR